MADPAIYVLCYAQGDSEPVLLLVRRQLIQKQVDGRTVPGVIPDWAGQWGCVAGQPKNPQSIGDSAYAVMLAQTGIDLSDPNAATAYGVAGTSISSLQDANYNPVPVLYVECSTTGLASLIQVIQSKLQANAPADGVLQTAEARRQSEARNLIGPLQPPPDGWKNYLIQNYYGGKAPGQLNTEIDTLTAAIAVGSAQLPSGSLIALDNIPKSGKSPTPPIGPAIETCAMIANNNPYPIKIRATIASESDWASTTNRPDKTFAGVGIEPFGVAVGQADLASAAPSAKVRIEMTIDGEPTTMMFEYDQRTALSSIGTPQAIASSCKTRKYAINQTTRTNSEGRPELDLVITEERGN